MAAVDVTRAFTRRRVIRDELIGLFGVVERNVYLTKRYLLWDLAFLLWTVANTLTIVFIARGVGIPPAERNPSRRSCSSAASSGRSSGSSSRSSPRRSHGSAGKERSS